MHDLFTDTPEGTQTAARNRFPPPSPDVLAEARQALERHGPAIEGQGGDLHTFVAAALLRNDFGLSEDEAWPLFAAWNATCFPPWDEADLRAKLAGGAKYGTAEYGCRRTFDEVGASVFDTLIKSAEDAERLVDSVRKIATRRGISPIQRTVIERELRKATGFTKRDLALPPAVDFEAKAAKDARRKSFEEREDPELIDPDDAKDTAERFLESTVDHAANPRIVRYMGEFFTAEDTHYRPISDEEVAAQIYAFLGGKRDVATDKPIKPDRALVEGILHALRAAALINIPDVPAWIGNPTGRAPAKLIVPFQNGLIDLDSRQLLKPTRAFFTLNAREFRYLVKAPAPLKWFTFMRDVFGDDAESIETLQEICGLLMTADTSFQKAFLIIGPPRSGKGTFLRVLRALVGAENVAAPTLAGLGGSFGLQGLIGKLLAAISDARLSSRADIQTITETILRVTGEDAISIPRKFKGEWTTKLAVRFVIVSNELPALLDQSGALASRFIVLRLVNSFLGKEDPSLTDHLLGELPGIATWALDGLDRLYQRGHFRQPAAALESVRQLEMLASPIKAFVEERCILEPHASVSCGELYSDWCSWATTQGREQHGTAPLFGRNLAAALPSVRVVLRRQGGDRVRFYEGIRLRPWGEGGS